MKKHYDKASNQIALFLWSLVVLLLIAFLVQTLESEELVHGRTASDWYVQALKSVSSTFFTNVVTP